MRLSTSFAGMATVVALLATTPTSATPGLQRTLSPMIALDEYILKPFTAVKLIGDAFAACLDRRIIGPGPARYEGRDHRRIVACIQALRNRIAPLVPEYTSGIKRRRRTLTGDEEREPEKTLEDYGPALRFLFHPHIREEIHTIDVRRILTAGVPIFRQVMANLTSIDNDAHLKINVVKTARSITNFLGTMFLESKRVIADASAIPVVESKGMLHREIIQPMENGIRPLHERMTRAVNLSFLPYTKAIRAAHPGLPHDLRLNEPQYRFILETVENYDD